jgi:resuscitation-promoting factor RpfA
MLSGSGRHRRPRQAPALLVAAGVTGAGIAMPLLASGVAQAVSDETWDRTAECESGGLWSANTGSGYYGGFQLTLEMWEGRGGLVFADRPDLASRAQQIVVAERVLADQGEEGFPGCALLSGLWAEYSQEQQEQQTPEGSAGSGEATGPEDDAAAGSAEGDADPGEASEGGSGPGSGSGSPEQQQEQERPDAQPEAPDASDGSSGQPGTGQHRGEPDPAESRPEPAPAPEPEPALEQGPDQGVYEVRSGDMLSGIAAEFDVPGGWPTLYQANKTVIGGNPDHILPGQRLDLTVTGR